MEGFTPSIDEIKKGENAMTKEQDDLSQKRSLRFEQKSTQIKKSIDTNLDILNHYQHTDYNRDNFTEIQNKVNGIFGELVALNLVDKDYRFGGQWSDSICMLDRYHLPPQAVSDIEKKVTDFSEGPSDDISIYPIGIINKASAPNGFIEYENCYISSDIYEEQKDWCGEEYTARTLHFTVLYKVEEAEFNDFTKKIIEELLSERYKNQKIASLMQE